ncbi:helix-turn-helix domain-containing protein [Nocardiopsis sp. NRRL B-16309]|uniref:helix-turn-helix domain-containing protein n=1 Tax=Nocardiopsis sp. NRRL B-16309 TaxID=1519494 RepID=UPI000B12AD1D|nr:helix-turn-helix domain-containing protein [Nocardiopsis sp. NRRL B-16309]
MPPRIPDEKRAAIVADLQAGKTRNQIARDHDVSPSTVSKVANEEQHAFDRTQVIHATRAKQADNRARRARLSADLLSDAERLRKQLWEPTTIGAFGGREGDWHTAEVEEPPFADKRAILSSVQTAVRAHTELEKVDAAGSADGAKSMLGNLFATVKQAWEAESAGGPPAEPQAGRVGSDE